MAPLLADLAREHPGVVHLPLGMVMALPLALLASFRAGGGLRWTRTAFFLAAVGLLGSLTALTTGLLWGRLLGLIAPGAWFPPAADPASTQHLLRLHQGAALIGVFLGALCLWRLGRTWRAAAALHGDTAAFAAQASALRWWQRGVGLPTLLLGLAWLGTWGFCGRIGGRMVFGVVVAAPEPIKVDPEAEVPLRALDYASLEPVQAAPFRSAEHGHRWVRTWATMSGLEDLKAHRPLPAGAWVVLSSAEDVKGHPGPDPGPLYFREILADGSSAFAFYWPRVPEARRAEVDEQESVYWRGADPHLASCIACHAKR